MATPSIPHEGAALVLEGVQVEVKPQLRDGSPRRRLRHVNDSRPCTARFRVIERRVDAVGDDALARARQHGAGGGERRTRGRGEREQAGDGVANVTNSPFGAPSPARREAAAPAAPPSRGSRLHHPSGARAGDGTEPATSVIFPSSVTRGGAVAATRPAGESMLCLKCSTPNPDTSRFCATCGEILHADDDSATGAVSPRGSSPPPDRRRPTR